MVNWSQNAAQFGQVAMKRSVRFTIRLRARLTVAGGYHAGRRKRVQLLPVDSTRLGASLECPCTFAFPSHRLMLCSTHPARNGRGAHRFTSEPPRMAQALALYAKSRPSTPFTVDAGAVG
jgi:hypothetical protein